MKHTFITVLGMGIIAGSLVIAGGYQAGQIHAAQQEAKTADEQHAAQQVVSQTALKKAVVKQCQDDAALVEAYNSKNPKAKAPVPVCINK